MTLMIYENEGNSLIDIHKLIELCLSTNYFIFDNRVRIFENSGSIGLTLMVLISEAFLQRLEKKAIQEALTTNLAPLTYIRYLDDTHARFVYQYISLIVF